MLLKPLKTTEKALPKNSPQALVYLPPKEQLHPCHLLAAQCLVTGLEGQAVAEALPSGLGLLETID